MKGFLTIAACAAVIGFSPVANAQWYASGSGGLVTVQDSDYSETGTGISGTGEFEFDRGYVFSGAIGRQFGGFRVEGEVAYRQVDIDTLTVNSITVGNITASGLGTHNVEGDASSLSFMANAWYDINTGTNFVPYVGGGVGIARINTDIESVAGVALNSDESDTVFAYQLGAGVGYKVNPNIMVTVGYRYFATTDPEFEYSNSTGEAEFGSHNFEAGIRFTF